MLILVADVDCWSVPEESKWAKERELIFPV